jgi:ubiquinone/menaquinone biosynthesis C-methylase UbiE
MRSASLGHYVLGLEGVALLRTWLTGDPADVESRVEEIRRIVNNPAAPPLSIRVDAPEVDFQSGYTTWAGTYDTTPNLLTWMEEPVMRQLIDRAPPGRALDAACGTGRHTQYLHARGHHVIGVDGTAGMLEQARARLPDVDFRLGDLTALPVETAGVDLAVCALALAHFPDLAAPIRELARVTRPGGRVLLSDQHPLAVALGGQAFFLAEDGTAGFVKNYFHTHGVYLNVFAEVGLVVRECLEPPHGAAETELLNRFLAAAGMAVLGEAVRAAVEGLPGALIWELVRRA